MAWKNHLPLYLMVETSYSKLWVRTGKNSPIRVYVNSLLSHFQDNTGFDLFSIENEVPIYFAAFCQKKYVLKNSKLHSDKSESLL